MAYTPKPERRRQKRDRAIGRRYPPVGFTRDRRPGESELAWAKRAFREWVGFVYHATGTKKRRKAAAS
jgi:hypothetical protein